MPDLTVEGSHVELSDLDESGLWRLFSTVDGVERGAVLHELGARLFDRGEYEQAVAAAGAAAGLFRAAGRDFETARGLYGQAAALSALGEADQALPVLDEAADLFRTSGSERDIADCRVRTGEILAGLDRAEEALAVWEEAERLYGAAAEHGAAARAQRSTDRCWRAPASATTTT